MQPGKQPGIPEQSRGLAWGLNLHEPDVTTTEEIEAFRRISAEQLGMQQDGLDFWLETRPDVLKRYRLWAHHLRMPEANETPNQWSATGVYTMYLYAITGFEDGVRYGLFGMSKTMTKEQIFEQMALVFRYAGPRGMSTLAKAATENDWAPPVTTAKWPPGWAPDPDAFKSGADFSSPEASDADTRKILEWYERWMGEIPRHVRLLARHRPELLKVYRNRYENTLRVLPKQTEPWALLQISIHRGVASGIREGMLLARAWGVTKRQILEAISWGTFYGGSESLSLVDEVAGDVLDAWPQSS
jgi:alkylhydroperoxidase/carboxymuconolactone decarboxylase family protein YurZ